ncbi:MAG: peptidoglycan-binding protein [Candidatus Omnitrophica bacterium]|nr:peptidoglycan-binding protein [Candidatus Omnitrophota bacterium]
MRILQVGCVIFLVSIVAIGCSKKKEEVTGISVLDIEGEDKDLVIQTITSPEEPQAAAGLQPIPQPQPIEVIPLASDEMERNRQIQTALKNAGLYFGEIDGKIGILTRKAIEDFQKMKGLKVDGKVGPITWGELQKYLGGASTVPAGSRTVGAKKPTR